MARLVHGSQSEQGDSIQLAWDDEQIAEWFNRQVDRDGAGNLPSDAPLGVAGYRVDVRQAGRCRTGTRWCASRAAAISASVRTSSGRSPASRSSKRFRSQVSKRRPSEYWMPSYFCSWRGSSLVLTDEDYRRLHEHPDLQTPELAPRLLNREQLFRPVDDKAVPLEYGDDLRVPRPPRRPHARRARLHRAGARSAWPLGGDDSVPAPQGPRAGFRSSSARRPPRGG